MAGARPTLTGITSSTSRGGLFDQSNVANPISGADVNGTVINDNTVTLEVVINGVTQMGTFTTNASSNQDVTLTFTGIGGTTGGTGTGNPVVRGVVDGDNIVLTLSDNSTVNIDITSLATNQELQDAINALSIPQNITDLNDTPSALGTMNQILAVNAAGTALEWVNQPEANVAQTSFSSTENTIAIGPGTGGASVNLEAQPTVTGNANLHPTGTTPVTGSIQVQNLTIGADTGLVLVDSGSGVYTLRAQRVLTEAVRPTVTSPEPMTALRPAPEQTITFTPQGTDMVTAIDNVMVTTPPGVTVTPTTDTTGGTGTITIPAGETSTPFNYEVTSDVTTTSADGETTTTNEMQSINRYVPYWQSRSEPMDESDVVSGAISQDDWEADGQQFTAGPGSGLIYLTVLATSVPSNVRFADQATFPVRVSLVRTISIRLGDGTQPMFNVFRMPGGSGQTISNFRTNR